MIRFVDLTDQIIDGEKCFSFYDTVIDRYKDFNDCQVFEDWDDFTNCVLQDDTLGLIEYDVEKFIRRCKRLCPNWAFNKL